MKQEKSYVLIALASLFFGCATPYSQLTVDDRDELAAKFIEGEAELVCSLTSGYGKAASAGIAVDRQVEFFESGQWPKLAIDVMSVGFGGDKDWFYLGRAAEGLGYLDIAEKYYETSLSKGFGCRCLGKAACGNLDFPEVTQGRLAAVRATRRDVESMSDYELARTSELEFQAHVGFYQCRRWARGKASEALRAFMAALAAGAASGVIAGEIVDTGSVAENALMGAAIGISTDATSRIYRQIRFPESENRGKDFAYLFDECMEANGFYATGDRLKLASWKFTGDEEISLVGLRGKAQLLRELGPENCKIKLQYFNEHTEITNPTIELTLFDSKKQSLSEHVISYPSVFPDKTHIADLEVSAEDCKLTVMGYISRAVDQVSGQEIGEIAKRMIPACMADEANCRISTE